VSGGAPQISKETDAAGVVLFGQRRVLQVRSSVRAR
jgi:hypothetical protein